MPLAEYYYNDEVLGKVWVKRSARSRHIGLKIKGGEVVLVLPIGASESAGLAFLRSKRDWIMKHLSSSVASHKRTLFDEESDFSTLTFRLKIDRGPSPDFRVRLTNGLLTITCPAAADLHSDESQAILRRAIERAMRIEATRVLPPRLATFARQFGFSYTKVSIRSSQSRWGSRSSSGSINLSYFLMTLPAHLVDYVLLHELCHTVEMNHGPAFWALMRKVSGGKSDSWREEIKQYSTTF